ncbi:Prefoldin subunit 6 [Ceratocystis pirilliformis]|uniref:Prefoldin subunit 6 n=3 Tax=Ceratocystis TaxID=5157 RepID=A0A2C5W0R5_9PEZI|nr:Prefoldin subunit 6 [Ceratocystis fimbriata CBS 114723]
MDALQAKLQALSDDFQKLQQDLQEKVAARQKLDSQKQENLTVQAEFERLKDGDVIYKTVGPVLLKQEKFEAENTVSGRLDFISGEISRVEVQIKEIQDKMETKKTEIIQVQSSAQATQAQAQQPVAA